MAEPPAKDENIECEKSSDGKHHFKISSEQHAISNHTCYVCAFCYYKHCVNKTEEPSPFTFPTREELER